MDAPTNESLPFQPIALGEADFACLFADGDLRRQIQFILEVEKLKQVLRRTPLLDGSRRENDAEHTWELALMAMVLHGHSDGKVDLARVIKMLLIHDIVEIDAGDTFIYDVAASLDQEARELLAAERIFGILPGEQAEEFRALWDEFEARQTPEAKFARAMDRLQPLLHNFFTGGGTWHTPGVVKGDVLERKSPIGHASGTLWEAAQRIIDEGVRRGFLRSGEPA